MVVLLFRDSVRIVGHCSVRILITLSPFTGQPAPREHRHQCGPSGIAVRPMTTASMEHSDHASPWDKWSQRRSDAPFVRRGDTRGFFSLVGIYLIRP